MQTGRRKWSMQSPEVRNLLHSTKPVRRRSSSFRSTLFRLLGMRRHPETVSKVSVSYAQGPVRELQGTGNQDIEWKWKNLIKIFWNSNYYLFIYKNEKINALIIIFPLVLFAYFIFLIIRELLRPCHSLTWFPLGNCGRRVAVGGMR